MGKSKLQTPEMQGSHAHDQDHAMELTDKKHNDLWTPHRRNTTHPEWKNGIIHVPAYPNDDEPQMERRRMVPGEKSTLRKDTATDNSIMARQNASNDNANADTRTENLTPKNL